MPLIQSTICAVFALWMFIGIAGCGESPQQMFETAQFEELQNNQKHARELYERIIQKHPDSEFAKKAALRLAKLQSKPGH